MKKNNKMIIAAILLWIPLTYVVFNHLEEENVLARLGLAILHGPGVFLFAGFGALALGALMTGAVYVLDKLDWSKGAEKIPYEKQFTILFSGAFGVLIAVLYYFTITNKHLFYRIYGGW